VLCVCVFVTVAVISELARSAKAFAELGGRTHPLVSDIVVALVEMGRHYTRSYLHVYFFTS